MTGAMYAFLARPWSGLAIAAFVALLGLLLARARIRGKRTVASWLGYLVLALGAVLAVGSAIGMTRSSGARSMYPPMGKLVDVGGYRMHILAEGDGRGRPTLVWISGGHDGGLALYHLHKEIRSEARSILFDRPGTGWSDPGPFPRTTPREVEELAVLLEKSGEQGPFILIGHSYGGLLAANFARRHRDRTAAVVLLDPTPPDVFLYLPGGGGPNIPLGIVRQNERSGWKKLFGLSDSESPATPPADTSLARLLAMIDQRLEEVRGPIDAGRVPPTYHWTMASIFREWEDPREIADLTVYDGELGDLPVFLVVPAGKDPTAPRQLGISGPDSARVVDFLEQARIRYFRTSTRSELIHTPPGTGHNYPYEVPDFVLEVVRRVLALP